MNTVTKDYVVYQPSGSNEYLLYNYVEGKEITREGQPYFTALSLSDNGETRLDVYAKDALSSPIAKIKCGLGMNKDGEVVIYDGDETVYAVPFLSMEKQYQNGKDFLGGLTLTQAQKEQYHCD